VLPYVKSGKVIAIGVGTAKRSPGAPDVPTVAEQGYPDYESYTWYAMFAPPGLPREVTLRLNAILNEALKKPDIIKSFTAQGAEPSGGSPEDLGKLVRADYERWRKVVVAAKIEAEE
jgi:tripartite-type tricarboxylate transporter receptor subunit TctC